MATNRALTGAHARMRGQDGGSRAPQGEAGGGGGEEEEEEERGGAPRLPRTGGARMWGRPGRSPPPPRPPPRVPTAQAATPQKEHWNRSRAVGAEKPKEERAALLRRTMAVEAGKGGERKKHGERVREPRGRGGRGGRARGGGSEQPVSAHLSSLFSLTDAVRPARHDPVAHAKQVATHPPHRQGPAGGRGRRRRRRGLAAGQAVATRAVQWEQGLGVQGVRAAALAAGRGQAIGWPGVAGGRHRRGGRLVPSHALPRSLPRGRAREREEKKKGEGAGAGPRTECESGLFFCFLDFLYTTHARAPPRSLFLCAPPLWCARATRPWLCGLKSRSTGRPFPSRLRVREKWRRGGGAG
jgi:hypothetical protein